MVRRWPVCCPIWLERLLPSFEFWVFWLRKRRDPAALVLGYEYTFMWKCFLQMEFLPFRRTHAFGGTRPLKTGEWRLVFRLICNNADPTRPRVRFGPARRLLDCRILTVADWPALVQRRRPAEDFAAVFLKILIEVARRNGGEKM